MYNPPVVFVRHGDCCVDPRQAFLNLHRIGNEPNVCPVCGNRFGKKKVVQSRQSWTIYLGECNQPKDRSHRCYIVLLHQPVQSPATQALALVYHLLPANCSCGKEVFFKRETDLVLLTGKAHKLESGCSCGKWQVDYWVVLVRTE